MRLLAWAHSLLDMISLYSPIICVRNSTFQMRNLSWRRNRCYRKLVFVHWLSWQSCCRDYLFFSSFKVKALEILREMNSFTEQSHQTRE